MHVEVGEVVYLNYLLEHAQHGLSTIIMGDK
jgi:hypothetical protein